MVSTGVGIAGPNIEVSGNEAPYAVFFGSARSLDYGDTWSNINSGNTHPNDGPVLVDPVDGEAIFFTDDQGLAGSGDFGETLDGLS